MSLLKTILLGRENGFRASLRKKVFGGGAEDTSPGSSYSAPRGSDAAAPAPAERALGLKPEAPKDVTPPKAQIAEEEAEEDAEADEVKSKSGGERKRA